MLWPLKSQITVTTLLPPSPPSHCRAPLCRMASSASLSRHPVQTLSPSRELLRVRAVSLRQDGGAAGEQAQQEVKVKTSTSFINWGEPLSDLY